MLEIATISFATFFATIGPIDVAAIFAVLTADYTNQRRNATALKAALIAATILLVFAFVGDLVLQYLGIGLGSLRTAGGILLLLISIEMVFVSHTGGTSITEDENAEAKEKSTHTDQDIAVFPMALPLIAGPGALGGVVLLMSEQSGNYTGQVVIVSMLLFVLLITYSFLMLANKIYKLFGRTGTQVVSRVFGVILAALSVQFIFDGIKTTFNL